MTEKMQKAIDRLDKQSEKGGDYAKLIAQHLISCVTDDCTAGLVLNADKSLAKCLDEIQKKVRKQAKGNCAVIEDAMVYRWAKTYYGLGEDTAPCLTVVKEARKKEDDLDIDLFDLL